MDWIHKLLCIVVGVLFIGLAVGAWEHGQVREDKARLEERQRADAVMIAQKDADLKTSREQFDKAVVDFNEFKRASVAAQQALETRFAQAQTAQQNAALTEKLLGLAVGDVKVGGTKERPTLEIPVAQQREYEKTCEECKLKLLSAGEQIKIAGQRESFMQTKIDDLQFKLDKITGEKKDLEKFAGGGATGTRIKHDVKAGFYGAAIEAVLLALTGHLK